MNLFKRRKILKGISATDLVPVRRLEHQAEEDGTLTLLVPKFRNAKVAKFMLGKRRNCIFIHLDKVGSFVWQDIDGIKNLRELSRRSISVKRCWSPNSG
jgi:hypothetical protein